MKEQMENIDVDDLSDLIASVNVQLARLGLSKDGFTARLLLKSAGLPRWKDLDREGYTLVLKILKSAKPEQAFAELWARCDRLELALIELVDGGDNRPTIAAIQEERVGRLRQATDATLRSVHEG